MVASFPLPPDTLARLKMLAKRQEKVDPERPHESGVTDSRSPSPDKTPNDREHARQDE